MLHDLRLWSKTLTPSNKRSGCSMNLQRGQGQNQTWTTQPSLNASTGCWAKPTLSSSRTRTRQTSSISTRVFDDESGMENESNLVMKEISVVVANIDQFGTTTTRFLESPAANGIAGFMVSEMHVKDQGLVKLRSKFALQGFTARFVQRFSLSCRNLVRAVVLRHCSGPTSLFRTLSAPSTRSCGLRLVVDDPFVERHTCDVCLRSPYLQYRCRGDEPSETFRDRLSRHECRHTFHYCRGWNVPPSELLEIELACPY